MEETEPGPDDGDGGRDGAGSEDDPGGVSGPPDAPTPFEPGSALERHWKALLDDDAATAGIYREEGRDVLELHPIDATALTDAEVLGIGVTVPTNEFKQLGSWVEGGRFGEYEVYRAETGRVFLLVVARDETGRRMVCVPAPGGSSPCRRRRPCRRYGPLPDARPGADGERVTPTHDDPGPFFPGGRSGSSESGESDAERDGDGRTSGSGSESR